ncbi:hypothetical protein GMD88_10715 [Pseudoflavonifractor sp. BIOML-A6]|nr:MULTISPECIES: hypothetical protein [unclassified Pseudoflavonifractor]MTQ97473.1 hypothetical protein [Pseudoflavonifractor sp. BIOML-A16]MTR06565.1 hypothetical protein [Pseudoflavonifractor sp. BIOML-A15]MTR31946.1 hypothetical protein [Pseudoflavonifractor sp. BIOML-A14]MTR74066.1 hypothetical protein [Pseudoflavonifractor sp. BIOML-A18]MTS64497.1 hypothetical protein [Pseudoflavonifractor sp. BIOML-A5]MTS72679.1 hypothetical protein [Pseudoflavonifractor sp. BIOML-A8]MTS90225.1 hypoth
METELIPAATEAARAFLTTPFEDYTVTEGFLLLFFLAGFVWLCIWFFKGGF